DSGVPRSRSVFRGHRRTGHCRRAQAAAATRSAHARGHRLPALGGVVRRRHADRRRGGAQQRHRRGCRRHRFIELHGAEGGAARSLSQPFGRFGADRAKRSECVTPKYAIVFFDVDSTLVTIEGIDVLGEGNPEVARLTDAAMNGEIPLDQVYARRLEMIRPSRAAVDALADRYRRSLVDGAEETIDALHSAGVAVHLVTAGIEQAVTALAEALGIPPRGVHAVD